MANDKLYITISNKSDGNGTGDSDSKKKKEKDPAGEFKSYLVHQSLDLIKSKTLSAIDKSVNRIGTFKGDYIASREQEYAIAMVKQGMSIGSSMLAGLAIGGGIGAIAGGAFAFGSILIDNVQDIIDYKQAYNVQQYEIDLIRQRSGLNSTTNESRTGD